MTFVLSSKFLDDEVIDISDEDSVSSPNRYVCNVGCNRFDTESRYACTFSGCSDSIARSSFHDDSDSGDSIDESSSQDNHDSGEMEKQMISKK